MPFPDLSSFVQQQFSAFSGYDEYDAQLSIWAHMRRHAAADRAPRHDTNAVQRVAAWRAANPERFRTIRHRLDARRWLAKKQSLTCRRCSLPPAPGSVLCEGHGEWQRVNKRNRRDKRAAYLGIAP